MVDEVIRNLVLIGEVEETYRPLMVAGESLEGLTLRRVESFLPDLSRRLLCESHVEVELVEELIPVDAVVQDLLHLILVSLYLFDNLLSLLLSQQLYLLILHLILSHVRQLY